MAESQGRLSFKGWPLSFSCCDNPSSSAADLDEAGNVIETHEHAGEFKEW